MNINIDAPGALTPEAKAYIRELAAEIAANGNVVGDPFEEMAAAHARRQAFAREMADGNSFRAKAVRAVIATKIHADIQWSRSVGGVFWAIARIGGAA